MKGDQEISGAELETERLLQRGPIEQRKPIDIVDPETADQKHSVGLFTELYHTLAIDFRGDEVQVRHLGDRMADGVIE